MNINKLSNLKNTLKLRAKIIQAIRTFFVNNDYLEVETPCRIPTLLPEAHVDIQTTDKWFLQTSPEACMKMLLASGCTRIFQICKCFRRNERGNKHLPEFTLLEWYCAESDYLKMMVQCESLIQFISKTLGFKNQLEYQGKQIDLSSPWNRMSVAEAFLNYTSISVDDALLTNKFDEIIACEIEPNLGIKKPLFLYDYPVLKGAFAKTKDNNSKIAERFELYISGIELCNAYTEINNPDKQKEKFEYEQNLRKLLGKQIHPIPENFLKFLKYMPDASGNALGIDRLIMLFANTDKIDNTVAFTPESL